MIHRGSIPANLRTGLLAEEVAPRTLRDKLRLETAPHHEAVDRAFSDLDLCQRTGLARFLVANLASLRAIGCGQGQDAQQAELLRDEMITALEADLKELGVAPDRIRSTVRFEPTAVLYVLLGSRLGTQVLRRRWLGATDRAVLEAGRYFGLPQRKADWHNLCMRLTQTSAQSSGTDGIVRDVQGLFNLYGASLIRSSTPALANVGPPSPPGETAT